MKKIIKRTNSTKTLFVILNNSFIVIYYYLIIKKKSKSWQMQRGVISKIHSTM
jgi:hypothetical protein